MVKYSTAEQILSPFGKRPCYHSSMEGLIDVVDPRRQGYIARLRPLPNSC